MAKDHVAHIEGQLKEFRKHLADLAAPTDYTELLRIIHHPGWTTPAEFTFVSAILDNMIGSVRALAQLEAGLLKGTKGVKTTD